MRRAALLGAVALAAALGALLLGPFPASPAEVFQTLGSALGLGRASSPALEAAILQVRLPRVLLAMLVGGALATSGAAYQSVFRNPLVSPHVLGVASGASFGAALAILLSAPPLGVQAAALGGGLLAVGLVLLVLRTFREASVLHMVLLGLVASSFFSALVSLLTYMATPDLKMPAIVFWLMGSLSSATPSTLAWAAPPILVGLAGVLVSRWALNVLSLGDEEARSLGLDAGRWRLGLILACTLMTAGAVCACGVVGWVGLVVPHLGRLLVGPDHRRLLPVTLVLGGIFLLGVDGAARTLSQAEVPLGILTGLIGAPVFALLLLRMGWRG